MEVYVTDSDPEETSKDPFVLLSMDSATSQALLSKVQAIAADPTLCYLSGTSDIEMFEV